MKVECEGRLRVTQWSLRKDRSDRSQFLPTEQSTGLPLHINADFFPEADRKALIFKGNQHEQLWNEMLIATAARQLAGEVERLTEVLGHKNTWNLIGFKF